MRPPRPSDQVPVSMREVLGQALGQPGLNRATRARLQAVMRMLAGLDVSGRTALDLRLDTGKPGRLEALVERAMEQADLDDREAARLKDAIGRLVEIDLGGGLRIDDLLPGRDTTDPGQVFERPDIDLGLFNDILLGEIVSPTKGADLVSVANAALAGLREKEPEVLPREPVATGELGAALPLGPETFDRLVRLAAAGLATPDRGEPDKTDPDAVVWDDGTSELLVHLGRVKTEMGKEVVRVTVPVATDEGDYDMVVPFAVGSEKRVTGLVAAAPDRPIGNALIAEIWGEALIALAYRMILEVADSIAAASGRDTSNDRLVAQGLSLENGALVVQSQAAFRIREATR